MNDTLGDLLGKVLLKRLTRQDPVQAAITFGALLTVPELQSNCNTIETMVQLALAHAEGKEKPSAGLTRQVFAQLSAGPMGFMEDPAEDVMVGAVFSPWGNFRILEGIWEGSTFYLQRFMDVLGRMPEDGGYERLKRPVLGLLKLSELTLERSRLSRWQLGEEIPAKDLPQKGLTELIARRRHLRFTPTDLKDLGIEIRDLTPFVLDPSHKVELRTQHPNESGLQRRPLVYDGTNFFLVLPTAVSAAIRTFIIEDIADAGMMAALSSSLCQSYARILSDSNFVGRIPHFPRFTPFHFGRVAEVIREVDDGRFCHLVFCFEAIDDFLETGLMGHTATAEKLGQFVEKSIRETYEQISSRQGFKEGLSLVVLCGVGRGSFMQFARSDFESWRIEGCSAYDFTTLDGLDDFSIRNFWRILEARDKATEFGALLVNVSGLINLIGWSRSLKGHVVPHGTLPDDFISPTQEARLLMATNSHRHIRHEAAVNMDEMVQPFVDGRLLHVRRNILSPFADDKVAPLYGSLDPSSEGIYSLFMAPARAWWAEVTTSDDTPRAAAYEYWKLVAVWLSRAAPVLDHIEIGDRPILWRCEFEDSFEEARQLPEIRSYEVIRDSITISVDADTRIITTSVGRGFNEAQFDAENSAERALVGALVKGVAILAQDADPDAVEAALLPTIVQNSAARQGHAFAIKEFRDTVHDDIRRRVIEIEPEDDAFNRFNLGWSVRSRDLGPNINGKDECISFLNAVVGSVEEEIIDNVRRFGRLPLTKALLRNHEAVMFERSRWERTSSALIGLHGRSAETFDVIRERIYSLNAASQSSRNLTEIAMCEAADGGDTPGEFDIALLMAKASLLFEVGGWSDAIRWGLMKPEVRITPLGDIHADFSWFEEIVLPHAKDSTDVRLEYEIETYAKHVAEPSEAEPLEGELDEAFNAAWVEQFGVPLDDTLSFVRALENLASSRRKAVLEIHRSELEALQGDGIELSQETVRQIIDALTLVTRASWRTVPKGFEAKDLHPWRFRRRLSLVRRPLVQLSLDDDPLFLVAPGMLVDGLVYSLIGYHHGDFPQAQFSPLMRKWQAKVTGERGTKFATKVATALESRGWQTKVELNVTELFGRRLDRDYGDIDVLAWNSKLQRIAVIECKDLQFKKTVGELAEQLDDYRGETSKNGRRDSLRKHLDRMVLIRRNVEVIKDYTGLSVSLPESHLMFSNPVPMEHSLERANADVEISNYNNLDKLFGIDDGQ